MEHYKLLEWQAPDHDQPERPVDWFISVAVVGTAVTVASLFVNNPLFALFAFLATGSIILHAAKKPELIDITITNHGVIIRHKFYPYSKLHSFCLDHKKNNYELLLHSDRAVLPHLIVPIRDIHPEEVRAELRQHIPERYAHKNLIDKIIEYLEI